MGHANSFQLILFFEKPKMSLITIVSLEGKFTTKLEVKNIQNPVKARFAGI